MCEYKDNMPCHKVNMSPIRTLLIPRLLLHSSQLTEVSSRELRPKNTVYKKIPARIKHSHSFIFFFSASPSPNSLALVQTISPLSLQRCMSLHANVFFFFWSSLIIINRLDQCTRTTNAALLNTCLRAHEFRAQVNLALLSFSILQPGHISQCCARIKLHNRSTDASGTLQDCWSNRFHTLGHDKRLLRQSDIFALPLDLNPDLTHTFPPFLQHILATLVLDHRIVSQQNLDMSASASHLTLSPEHKSCHHILPLGDLIVLQRQEFNTWQVLDTFQLLDQVVGQDHLAHIN
ncbi:hypothetical protein BC939DRAFT_227736 [Gamsiella multidivaricata]|uniref:uncharacterized protein n=1 Tax=Gamsiella multidivaricata TaxID=101098 RepID=UPI00222027E5|nr:uncharacterized protein BC939DRAFT_227736 [Gamsiella multidivaricata]KAI7820637.1 hypothetical protein BC939DRAFT_227736 [Gamsiella multidivaricata]